MKAQQPITPHLWFDKEAKEATALYVSLFPDSKVEHVTEIHDTPSGDTAIVSFVLAGQPFMAISAGPLFKFNQSISFHVKCQTKDEVDEIWKKLSPGGKILLPLDSYPFSERYGWIQDRYGLSWQIAYVGAKEIQQKITPVLLFMGDVCGKTEEAVAFYTALFADSKQMTIMRYGTDDLPNTEGTVKYAAFSLSGMEFGAMDSAKTPAVSFNEAISFIITCETQKDIDYYWEKLSADPKAEQCGWLKDRFGVSWQVVPSVMGDMMSNGTPEQIGRVTQAFLPMKKFDISVLEKAYKGE